jgi:plastocyanin
MMTQAPLAAGAQSYTVLVGAMDMKSGAAVEAFFPATLHIHTGDRVTWKENGNEIHTVTFLGGQNTPDLLVPLTNGPEGAMMFNPLAAFPAGPQDGQYDGSGYANSGIMGNEQGQTPTYSLTFTKPGTYSYICIVHSQMKMTGTIVVEGASASILSPADASAQGQQELSTAMAKIPAVISAAQALEKPDQKNADGTTTHYVMVGYNDGQIDMMSFFPSQVAVKPGDTVIWTLSPQNMAPHTVTFLNGANEPALLQAIPQTSGPPLLSFNPSVALPQNSGQPLSNQGIFSSGVMDPAAPGPHSFTIKIGDISGNLQYECLLHDSEGMVGTLTISK